MHYEKTSDPENPHKFLFEGWEVRVFRAAYTESANLQEQKGNSGSVSGQHRGFILATGKARRKRSVTTSDPTRLAEDLEDFAARTDEQVVEIAHNGLPLYENTYTVERRRLGEWAASLAAEIRGVSEEEPEEPEEDQEELVRQFREELDSGGTP